MLLPHQVLPFLQHEDRIVRDHVVQYLRDAHDPAPATADHIWEALDRFPGEADLDLIRGLPSLPQTSNSIERLVDRLETWQDHRELQCLLEAVDRIDLPLLQQHRDRLLESEVISEEQRAHIEQRLALADEPAEGLWERLMEFAGAIDVEKFDFDERVPNRLIEAIARRPGDLPDRAMRMLQDEQLTDWREVYCVKFLGQVPHEPAAGLLMEKLLLDGDMLSEAVAEALTRIGTAEVVRQIEAFYANRPWHVRLYLHDPLANIKRPESEQVLLRLLDSEPDRELRERAAAGLCLLCTEAANLEKIRDLLAAGRLGMHVFDLTELLLGAGGIVGYEPPEGKKWRQWIAQRRISFLRALEAMDQEQDKAAAEDAVIVPGGDEEWSPTFRREAPKVGRNDPCPCGSGKKYKRCCLGKAEALSLAERRT